MKTKASERQKRKIKKALRVTGGLFGAVLFFAAALFLIHRWENRPTVSAENTEEQEQEGDLYFNGAWYSLRQDLQTAVLFGVDKYTDQQEPGVFINYQQADYILLLVLDERDGLCRALPLNRDTMTRVSQLDLNGLPMGSRYEQLALSHTYGSGGEDSGRNVARAVSDLLYGVPVEHFIGISMDAVSVLADAVDGVPVTVEQDFSGITDQLPMGETVLLKGPLALQFVRARGSVGEQTNLERMSRQQQFMTAFYPRWREKSAAGGNDFLLDVLDKLSADMTTDCSAAFFSSLSENMESGKFVLLDPPVGEAVTGEQFMEFYVEEEALQKTVVDLFYRRCES